MFNLEDYIVEGKMDRFLLRPLSPLFQVYADEVSDNNISKLIANSALIIYSASEIGLNLLTSSNVLYGAGALASGVLVLQQLTWLLQLQVSGQAEAEALYG